MSGLNLLLCMFLVIQLVKSFYESQTIVTLLIDLKKANTLVLAFFEDKRELLAFYRLSIKIKPPVFFVSVVLPIDIKV